jgi:7-carboxy-7-deazaguanine synthase
MMNVNEIFCSIQGEGPRAGRLSTFIRLAGCNLNCSFCDTKYANEGEFKKMTPDEIFEEIKNWRANNLVITGGEPLCQQKEMYDLLGKVRNIFKSVEIETNGTLKPEIDMLSLPIYYNVSPKLSNSGMIKHKRLKKESLKHLAHKPNTIFKFVLSSQENIYEVLDLMKEFSIPKEKVWLMPEGTSNTELKERGKWLVETCKMYGFNFSPRLHVWLWGKTRGV